MLRRAATRSTLVRPSFAPTLARSFAVLESGGKMGEREKAVEDRAIRSHDLDLLKKLRESLGIQENQPIPESVVSQVSSGSSSMNPFAQRAQSQQNQSTATHHNDEPLTRAEFLEFRREIVQRLRDLEDDIMDLQTRRK